MSAFNAVSPSPTSILFRRLDRLVPLSPGDGAFLEAGAGIPRNFPAGAEIVGQGCPPPRACVIVSGWAAMLRVLSDGRRQILRLLFPGDLIAEGGGPSRPSPATVRAMTALVTVEIEPALAVVRERPADHPRLSDALALLARQAEVELLNAILRLGRQMALERTAHLLLELRDRLAAVGLAERDRFPLPLTQEALADTLGLSTVHMNRSLQELRRERLLRLDGGVAELLDPQRLAVLADYELPEEPPNTGPATLSRPGAC